MAIKCILQNQFNQKSLEELEGILPVESGGTGKNELTAGSFLVGDGTNAVILKTPEEVLADIGGASKDELPSVVDTTIGTNWTEDSTTGVKTQTVTISGITAADNAKVDVRYTGDGTSDGYATFVEHQNQFLERVTNGFAETVADGIKFTIFGDATTVSIPIFVEVI